LETCLAELLRTTRGPFNNISICFQQHIWANPITSAELLRAHLMGACLGPFIYVDNIFLAAGGPIHNLWQRLLDGPMLPSLYTILI
jgi:hypothetical protein